MPGRFRDYLIIASGLGGLVCLDGDDGRVYWFRQGDTEPFGLLNSSLGQFVEVLTELYPQIVPMVIHLAPDANDEQVAAVHQRLEQMMESMVERLRPLDPVAFGGPRLIWQVIILSVLEGTVQG